VAVSLSVVPAAGAVGASTSITVAVAPGASVPRLQMTGVLPVQAPWLAWADTSVVCGGGSVSVTSRAAPAPSLVTVKVMVNGLPTTTGLGATVPRSVRRAGALTVPVAVGVV
jgi:hypothetical protein